MTAEQGPPAESAGTSRLFDEPSEGATCARPKSVVIGKDKTVIPLLLDMHAKPEPRILDACHNKGVMWKGLKYDLTTMDIDPQHGTDYVADFRSMPFPDDSFDVVAFDPPHLPNAYATNDRTTGHADSYGVRVQDDARSGDNVSPLFVDFLIEARRVLAPGGIVIAKIADLVHNHLYQWQHVDFINAARSLGMNPCDVAIKVDPTSGNLASSKWKRVLHLRRAHLYWIVVRTDGSCETCGRVHQPKRAMDTGGVDAA